jgi:hypothetical protein
MFLFPTHMKQEIRAVKGFPFFENVFADTLYESMDRGSARLKASTNTEHHKHRNNADIGVYILTTSEPASSHQATCVK